MSKLCVMLEDQGEIHCAQCDAVWNMPVIAKDFRSRRLRAKGFAFIDFGDALCLNYCPQCELPTATPKEVPWPTTPLLH